VKTKEHTEFDRWWTDWISRRTQVRVFAETRTTATKAISGIEQSADGSPRGSGTQT
jgi:hypothetical protein